MTSALPVAPSASSSAGAVHWQAPASGKKGSFANRLARSQGAAAGEAKASESPDAKKITKSGGSDAQKPPDKGKAPEVRMQIDSHAILPNVVVSVPVLAQLCNAGEAAALGAAESQGVAGNEPATVVDSPVAGCCASGGSDTGSAEITVPSALGDGWPQSVVPSSPLTAEGEDTKLAERESVTDELSPQVPVQAKDEVLPQPAANPVPAVAQKPDGATALNEFRVSGVAREERQAMRGARDLRRASGDAAQAAAGVDEFRASGTLRAEQKMMPGAHDTQSSFSGAAQVAKNAGAAVPPHAKTSSPPPPEPVASPPIVSENAAPANRERSSPLAAAQTFQWLTAASAAQPPTTSASPSDPKLPVAHATPIRAPERAQEIAVPKTAADPKPKEVGSEAKPGSNAALTVESAPITTLANGKAAAGTGETPVVAIAAPRPAEASLDHSGHEAALPSAMAADHLPAAPSGSPGVPLARLAESSGQSEMHIGLRTSAFGTVEVHAVVHDSQVGLAIGAERGDLHRLFANEVPGISGRLEQHNLRLDAVRFLDSGPSFDGGFGSGADPRSRGSSPTRTLASNPAHFREPTSGPLDPGTVVEIKSGLNVRA